MNSPLLRLLLVLPATGLFLSCGDPAGTGSSEEDTGGISDVTLDTFSPDALADGDGATDGSSTEDAEDTADGGTGQVGDPCTTEFDCESGICLPLGAGTGVCSDYCVEDENCPDGFECTVWQNLGEDLVTICVPRTYCFDPDGDEFGDGPGCRGPDCEPTVPTVNAGAPEICDGVDNDCDGVVDDQADGTQVNCDSGFQGVCGAGRTQCVDGGIVCVAFEVPGVEVCNGQDDDCNGVVDDNPTGTTIWYTDADGDRFGDESTGAPACTRPEGTVADAGDCDDDNRQVNPTVPEICDGADNDCDGDVDEAGAAGERSWYRDIDGDGYGDELDTVVGCAAPEGYVDNDDDCDDGDEFISPDATDVCDTIDNDCDGIVDNGSGPEAGLWYADRDGDTWGDGTDVVYDCFAVAGRVNRAGDCDDQAGSVNPGASETCNGVDDNCNTSIDEGVLLNFYRDADLDGRGDPADTRTACEAPVGYVSSSADCNDEEPQAWTGRAELCDGVDNNCDGQTDENAGTTYYADGDGDTWGNPGDSRVACAQPVGFVTRAGDCNDEEPQAWTGRAELCDGIDNNCDGQTDENAGTTYYADVDGDTWGNPADSRVACTQPPGFILRAGDCNDAEPQAWTGRAELCDGVDNNCNGNTDEGVTTTFYADTDNDGFGSPTSTRQACAQPVGFVTNNTDCDDTTDQRAPGRPETCDGLDNNCNSTIDEGVQNTYYRDQDGDTFGNAGVTQLACTAPVGFVTNTGDCNDNQPQAWTDRAEICDTIDNNCNGQTDEGVTTTFWLDDDNDTFGDPAVSIQACSRPARYVANNLDCDDKTSLRNPNATEICDNLDNDCDGQTDEGLQQTWYFDIDGDTWGNVPVLACTRPAQTATRAGDCNDSNLVINPGQAELCSTAFDDNCDGRTNDSTSTDATIWYLDNDKDGFGEFVPIPIPIATVRACTRPPDFCFRLFGICLDTPIPYVGNGSDCDDSSARARPGGGPEACDGYDNDCDGTRDNGFTRNVTVCRDRDDDGNGDPSTRITVCASPVDAASGDWVVPCTDFDDNE